MASALRIGNPVIEVRLRRNSRARRMILRLARPGSTPILTLPIGAPIAAAEAFLSDHEGWLRRHAGAAAPGGAVRDGSELPFRGGVLVIHAAEAGRARVQGDVLHVSGGPEQLPARVGAWLKEAARQDCVAGVERHAAHLRRSFGKITMRDTRSRWGSCTSAGDLMFSWRLVLAPPEVLDYVVAHEVAHLAEMNHSPRFWRQVGRLCPDYATPRQWLRRNGAGLHAYEFHHSASC